MKKILFFVASCFVVLGLNATVIQVANYASTPVTVRFHGTLEFWPFNCDEDAVHNFRAYEPKKNVDPEWHEFNWSGGCVGRCNHAVTISGPKGSVTYGIHLGDQCSSFRGRGAIGSEVQIYDADGGGNLRAVRGGAYAIACGADYPFYAQ
jgi:hypothetical protein